VASSLFEQAKDVDWKVARRSPWIGGSFYLASAVILGALFLVVAKSVPMIVLPIVVVASLLAVSIIGAFQLRHDGELKEKNFITLMGLTFKHLPLIRSRESRRLGPKATDEKPSEAGG